MPVRVTGSRRKVRLLCIGRVAVDFPVMNRCRAFGFAAAAVVLALSSHASGANSSLDAISSKDQVAALKTALNQGAAVAIGKLGVVDGFLGNPKVRIPLPGKLARAEKTLKILGLGPQTEQLKIAMNRAAEAAVPEAKTIFVSAVKKMTVQDAAAILTGPNDAATQYFKRATSEELTGKFLPIVSKATAKVDLANRYDALAGQAAQFGLIDTADASIESYVTRKALDGLFLMMAEEEVAIRKDPVGQTSKLLQKVFGALGK
jgi:Protein of unknown function (DUF4197)